MELEGAAGGGESKTTEQGRIAWAGQMRSEVKRKKGVRDGHLAIFFSHRRTLK